MKRNAKNYAFQVVTFPSFVFISVFYLFYSFFVFLRFFLFYFSLAFPIVYFTIFGFFYRINNIFHTLVTCAYVLVLMMNSHPEKKNCNVEEKR